MAEIDLAIRGSSKSPGSGRNVNEIKKSGPAWDGIIWDNIPHSGTIPQEVRDLIYGLAGLSYKHVQYIPIVDKPFVKQDDGEGQLIGPHSYEYCHRYEVGIAREPTYGFDATMMRVNRKTYENLKDSVIQNTKFILVEYSVPRFRQMLHWCNVPIIADQGLESCTVHTISIDLDWNTGPFCIFSQSAKNRPLNHDRGKILLVWKDLPKFFRMLKFMCQYTDPPATYVMSGRGERVGTQCHLSQKNKGISMTVNIDRQLKSGKQKELMDIILSVTGAGYNLKLDGVADDQGNMISQSLKQSSISMGPRLVWVRALFWARVQTASELKLEADKFAEDGNLRVARLRYEILIDHFLPTGKHLLAYFQQTKDTSKAAQKDRAHLERVCYGLKRDLCLSGAAIDIILACVNSNDIEKYSAEKAMEVMSWVQKSESKCGRGKGEQGERIHLKALASAACHKNQRLRQWMCSDIALRLFLMFVQQNPEHASPRAKNDWQTIVTLSRTATQDPDGDRPVNDALKQTSLLRYGFRRFQTLPIVEVPQGLEGWQDKEHLKAIHKNGENPILCSANPL